MKKILVPANLYTIKDFKLIFKNSMNDLFNMLNKNDNQYIIDFDYLKFRDFWTNLKEPTRSKTFTMFYDYEVLSKLGKIVNITIDNKPDEKVVVWNQNRALRGIFGDQIEFSDIWSRCVLKNVSKAKAKQLENKRLLNTQLQELNIKGNNLKIRRNSIGYFFTNLKKVTLDGTVAIEKYAITNMKCNTVFVKSYQPLKIEPQMCVNTLIDLSNCKDITFTVPFIHLFGHSFLKETFMRGCDWKDVFVSLCLCPKYKIDPNAIINFNTMKFYSCYDKHFKKVDYHNYVKDNIFDLRSFVLDVAIDIIKEQHNQEYYVLDYEIIDTVRYYINTIEPTKATLSTKFKKILDKFSKNKK